MNATPILLVGWRTRARWLIVGLVQVAAVATIIFAAGSAVVAYQACGVIEAEVAVKRAEIAVQRADVERQHRLMEVLRFRATEFREKVEAYVASQGP